MKPIGGYFSLELQTGEHEHKNAIMLNTARNCLEYILLAKQYTKLYIPYYTCEVFIEPLKRNNIDYQFYHVDESLEPVKTYKLSANEAFLYTNYFGAKNDAVKQLSKVYGKQLIVDSAQAFFAQPVNGIDTFYSARKFFGVADGGFLYTDGILNKSLERDMSFDRMSHLLKRIDISAEAAYDDFHKNDDSLKDVSIRKMSRLTDRILRGIDYKTIKFQRIRNFCFLNSILGKMNTLPIDFSCNDNVPMVYPFWGRDKCLRKKLIANKVYVATFWPNVFDWCNENDMEYILAKNIIPLPIDQRYNEEDMQQIIDIILN